MISEREETGKKQHQQHQKKGNAAFWICLVLTIIALIGIVYGFITKKPIWIILAVFPASIYEVIRTEGLSTKLSSVLLAVVLVAEFIFIKAKIHFDLSKFLGSSSKYIGGYSVPLGDISVAGCALMAVLSIILFIRTAGPYTKWLSVVLFVSSFVLIYSISQDQFQSLLKWGINQITRFL